MKRHDLTRHLARHGCVKFREGGNHTIWKNMADGRKVPVPRHNELREETAQEIRKQLGVPDPRNRP